MNNENIGIEFNGGGNNKVTNGKININGGGKGIVSNDSSNNIFTNVEINITAQNELLVKLKDTLNLIDDQTINQQTQQSYKTDSLLKIDEILSNPNNRLTNIANLTSILAGWIAICNPLMTTLQPYIVQLVQLSGG